MRQVNWRTIATLGMSVAVAGCSAELPTIDSRLQPVSESLLHKRDESTSSAPLKTAQPEPYASIIRQNITDVEFRFDDNLRALEIARLRVRQSRLPQITPGLSTGSGGVAAVDLNIRQVLFNGDLSDAMFHDANIDAVGRHIELLDSLNDNILEDIGTFLSYRENLERSELLNELSGELEALLGIAETRLEGGIGTADDVALFKLELAEIETEALIARSDAEVDRETLENIDVSLAARSFAQSGNLPPMDVLAAVADRDAARSNLAVLQEEIEPRVVVAASAGIDAATGTPSRNAGLRVEAAPLSFGGNADVLAAKQAVTLADRELEETVSDVSRDTRRLLQQIEALKAQENQTKKLAGQAEDRLEAFREEFQAGSASLTEAAGLVDILRRTLERKVDVRYAILDRQSQLAAILGHFWSL